MYKDKFKSSRKRRKLEFEKRITFRLDEQHFEELADYAIREGMNFSFLVRHLVIRFLETQRKQAAFPTIGDAP